MRDEWLAAVQSRLQHTVESNDLSPVLEPEALHEAQQLLENCRQGDVEARLALGWFHWFRFQERRAQTDLTTAVEAFIVCFVVGVGSLPEPLLPLVADAVVPRANQLLTHVQSSADPEPLSVAVDLWQRIVWATPADHPNHALWLCNLGGFLRIRYERTGAVEDLEAAIEAGWQAVAAGPTGASNRATALSNLGAALLSRFERTGVADDLDSAIDQFRRAVAVTPPNDPNSAMWLSNLGNGLYVRFQQTGMQADLDRAIDLYRRGLVAAPTGHPRFPTWLSNLGGSLLARFERAGRLEDLGEAIGVGQEAVAALPPIHPERSATLSHLGNALHLRFRRAGRLEDLEAAIDSYRQALARTQSGHPARVLWLSNLGNALRDRFERTGHLDGLSEAIAVGREAVASRHADHLNRVTALTNLAGSLLSRFQRTGALEDLGEAVAVGEEAVASTPANHPDQAKARSNLGVSLLSRFERIGALEDLESAIDHLRAVVAGTLVDRPDRPLWLSNLGIALQFRFGRTGDLEDLNTAISLYQKAVADTPPDRPIHVMWLSNLGSSLLKRFERTGTLEDLETALNHLRKAAAGTPADHPDRAMCLANFGNALRARFEQTGTVEDLDRAIEYFQRALASTPANHPRRATWLTNIGSALQLRAERSGDLKCLDTAIDHLRAAVAGTPVDQPDRAELLTNLGIAQHARFEQTNALEDLHGAVTFWVQASEVKAAAPSVRVRAGASAAVLMMQAGQVAAAAEVAAASVRLLPQVAPRRLKRSDQQDAVADLAGLASTAAALVLAAPGGTASGRAEQALGLLETGRAVLLSQTLESRSDLTDLTEQHPELAHRFAELRERLDLPPSTVPLTGASNEPGDLGLLQDRLTPDRHRLAADFTALLAEIRSLDGFSSFALPPTADELLAQTSEGPVIVFNISTYRSDALLLANEGITSLELSHLTLSRVIEQVNTFQRAQAVAMSGTNQSAQEEAQGTIVDVLKWLWDAAVSPVLEALGHHRRPDAVEGEKSWPRVWWVPGGLLGQLPLHAAGHHTDLGGEPYGRTVMDRVVSSYTPTVRALRYARERALRPAAETSAAARSLIVGMPTTPGLPASGRLRFVEAEVSKLQDLLPSPVLLSEPTPGHGHTGSTGFLPTKAGVLARLPKCTIAHFACHGVSDPVDPSQSRLLLHDHVHDPLTVASLAPIMLDQARLAYLSACRTAAIDVPELLDEAIHLTSAFQLAGFSHVIGTMWEINDRTAVTIAELFYANLQTASGLDPGRAAHALHKAVRQVRDGLPAKPWLWAAYLHAGG
ncbi:CHAT domain-containing tetratricopeptide repeat protein [Streptomyces avermitilis]|uniref:CHAT domain-containing tetratricopeptide repeat protein n=1 Tax=Streptomyces avermitilis TaxID=33903 RepID=UPI00341176BE